MMSNAHNTETQIHTPTAGFPASETSSEHGGAAPSYYAQPYSLDAQGFYFQDFADYEQKAENLRDRFGNPVEEFEIQFIDGDDPELFEACGITQANLETWFDAIDVLDDGDKIALFFLLSDLGYRLDQAIDKVGDVAFQPGRLREVAEEFFDEINEIPEHLAPYIDYERVARDFELSGDLCEFTYRGRTYTCTNPGAI